MILTFLKQLFCRHEWALFEIEAKSETESFVIESCTRCGKHGKSGVVQVCRNR